MSSHQLVLMIHFFAIALGIGVGFSNLYGLYIGKGQPPEINKGMAFLRTALRVPMDVVVLFILLSGGILLYMQGGPAGLSGWFQVKMIAVLVFLASYVFMRYTVVQMMKSGNMALAGRIGNVARVTWASAVIAMFSAVMAFAA